MVSNDARVRNGTVEHLRIIAALGIVCFHSGIGGMASAIGYAGLPVFVLISAFFATGTVRKPASCTAEPLVQFVARIARRLLLPWLVWVGFYLLCDLGLVLLDLREPSYLVTHFNPFFGTRIHLWYMPFIFLATLSLRFSVPLLDRFEGPVIAALAIAMGVFVTVLLPTLVEVSDLPRPAPQFLFATPAFLYGIALAELEGCYSGARLWIAVGLFLFVGEAAAIEREFLYDRSWLSYGLALPLAALALLVPKREDGWSRRLAPLTLGIYLIHPFVLMLVRRTHLATWFGLPEYLAFVLAFGGSAAIVSRLKHGRLAFAV